jgi:hypothetical protein
MGSSGNQEVAASGFALLAMTSYFLTKLLRFARNDVALLDFVPENGV